MATNKGKPSRETQQSGEGQENLNSQAPSGRWTPREEMWDPHYWSKEISVIPVDEAKPARIDWFADGRVALGALTVVAGESGSCKSLLGVEWAARASDGRESYDAAVIAHGADMTVNLLRSRLDAAGASVDRIAALSLKWPEAGDEMTHEKAEGRVGALATAVSGATPCKLLVVDCIEAWAGRIDQQPSRDWLNFFLIKLSQIAARTGMAIVAFARLSGPAGSRVAAKELASLSAVAPVVWLAARDEEDPERRLLLPVKNSLRKQSPAAAFRIENGRVAWQDEPVEQSATMLTPPSPRRAAEQRDREAAAEWLQSALADGPVESAELFRQARTCGISAKTLRRAGKGLGLKPRKRAFAGPWVWGEIRNGEECGAEESERGARNSECGAAERMKVAG